MHHMARVHLGIEPAGVVNGLVEHDGTARSGTDRDRKWNLSRRHTARLRTRRGVAARHDPQVATVRVGLVGQDIPASPNPSFFELADVLVTHATRQVTPQTFQCCEGYEYHVLGGTRPGAASTARGV